MKTISTDFQCRKPNSSETQATGNSQRAQKTGKTQMESIQFNLNFDLGETASQSDF